MAEHRVLVCGSRYQEDGTPIHNALALLHARQSIDLLIHGDCRGVDRLAAAWAQRAGIPTLAFPADWRRHGRAAGPIRNQRMLVEGRPDLVVAFPGGPGTLNMVQLARRSGVPVEEVEL